MRKLTYLFVLLLLATVFLSACRQNSGMNTGTTPETSAVTSSTATAPSSVAPSEKASVAPSPAANAAPSAKASAGKAFADINSGKLSFDQATERFFNGDVDAALNKMEPLLYSAAATEATLHSNLFYAGYLREDGDFAWGMIFRLINVYRNNDKSVKEENGSLVIPVEVMKGYFNTAFTDFGGSLPAIPSNLANGIKIDQSTGAYIVEEAAGEEYTFTLKNISLSTANSAADPDMSATLLIEISTPVDGNVVTNVNIEVKPNNKSDYQYSIQSVSLED